MYPTFTLDQLVAFLAVVDEGGFVAAAKRLGRVQSAVSYAIAKLEGALGSELFDRSGRTPVLTAAGRRLVGEARLVVGRSQDLAECAAELAAGTEPELRVALDTLYPPARLTELCAAFQRAFPATLLRVHQGLFDDATALLVRGDVDLGVLNLAGGVPRELSVSHLGVVFMVPVCAASHPLASAPAPQPGALLEQHVQIVLAERGGLATPDQGVLASRTWRVTELDLKIRLIRRGLGWGSVPLHVAEEGVADGSLARLRPDPWPPEGHRVDLHLAVRRDRPLGRAGLWLRDQLAAAHVTGGGPAQT